MRKLFLVLLVFTLGEVQAQRTEETPFLRDFIATTDTFNSNRLGLVFAAEGTIYTAAVVALYQYWYKNYPTEPFHLFNDNEEWLQMDKAGHIFTAYFETNLTTGVYKWTGMEKHKAYWSGFATASVFQLTIELFDAYSEKWGFSIGDLAANTLGAGLSAAQYFAWDEQRIQVKFSSHFVDYSGFDQKVQDRAISLYGSTGPEKVLKDYNGLTTWVSVNPYKFLKKDTWWPKWLMVSGGYGANGLYGGFTNTWCDDPLVRPEDCPPELLTDFSNIDRYRQYYLSLDVDLTAIETDSPFWNMMFEILSVVKVPAPAIEFNQGGGVRLYPLYF